MFSLNKQKNIFNQMFRERKYRLSIFGVSPHFDWKILLILILIIFIVVAVYAQNLLLDIKSIDKLEFNESVQTNKINTEEIQKNVNIFEKNKIIFTELMNQYAPVQNIEDVVEIEGDK
jgi:hypothetical protein